MSRLMPSVDEVIGAAARLKIDTLRRELAGLGVEFNLYVNEALYEGPDGPSTWYVTARIEPEDPHRGVGRPQ